MPGLRVVGQRHIVSVHGKGCEAYYERLVEVAGLLPNKLKVDGDEAVGHGGVVGLSCG